MLFKYPLNVPPWQKLSLKNLNQYSDLKGELESLFRKQILLTNSGRTALAIYLQNTYWNKKSIIVPAIICSSIVETIENAGLNPIIADVDENGNISIESIKELLKERKGVGGVVIAHMNGRAVMMDKLNKLIKQYNLKVIDDAAQALGGKYKNKLLGSFGDAGILSFGAGKIIVSGGGALITKNRIDVRLEDDVSMYPNIYWKHYRAKANTVFHHLKKKLFDKKIVYAIKGMNGFDAKINLLQLLELNWIIRRRKENARVVLQDDFNPELLYCKLIVPKTWIPKKRNFQIDIVNPPVGSKQDCPNAWKFFENHVIIPNEPWISLEGMEEISAQLQRRD